MKRLLISLVAVALVATAVSAVAVEPLSAGGKHQLRPPQQQHRRPEKASLGAGIGPQLLWKTKVGIQSQSNPYISDNAIWLYVNGVSRVALLDARNGSVIAEVGQAYPGNRYGPSEIIQAGTKVYYTASNYTLCRAAGNLAFEWKFGAAGMFHSSPLYVQSMNAIFVGNNALTLLYKLDAANGNMKFVTRLPGSGIFFQQVSYASKFGLILAGTDPNVVAVDAVGGNITWSTSLGGRVQTTAVFSDDQEVVYFGCDAKNVHALKTSTGKITWSVATGGAVYNTPSLHNGMLFVAAGGECYSFSAKTGKQFWNFVCSSYDVDAGWSRIHGDTVIFNNAQGVFAVNMNGSGIAWTWTGAGAVYGVSIVTDDGKIYVSDDTADFYALQLPPAAGSGDITEVQCHGSECTGTGGCVLNTFKQGRCVATGPNSSVKRQCAGSGTKLFATVFSQSASCAPGSAQSGYEYEVGQCYVNPVGGSFEVTKCS